jgi:tripartite-type tricarboxylate transporter receptor subunit TctC
VGYFGIGNLLPQVQEGVVKLLAVDGERRSALYPSAPTLKEAGFPGVSWSPWYGLFAPTGTPQAAIDRIYREISQIADDPEFTKLHVVARGLEPAPLSGGEFLEFLKNDVITAGRLVESAGLKP